MVAFQILTVEETDRFYLNGSVKTPAELRRLDRLMICIQPSCCDFSSSEFAQYASSAECELFGLGMVATHAPASLRSSL